MNRRNLRLLSPAMKRSLSGENGVTVVIIYGFLIRAAVAEKGRYDYFCTTLSISPHKNADWLMEIGETLAKECGVAYLPSDFKKKNGYKRSIELSKEYGLYRQNFCGCIYSRMAAAKEQ